MSDPPTAPTAQVLHASPGSSLRKERGAIAAQACDTCRTRKQRCDEQRPKCSTCQKFKLECNYREPQPTKKDKTLVEILERIKNLEGKVDSLALGGRFASSAALHAQVHPTTLPSTAVSGPPPLVLGPPLPASLHAAFQDTSATDDHFKYVSSVQQMLAWPAVQSLLSTAQLKPPALNFCFPDRQQATSMLWPQVQLAQSLPSSGSFVPPRPASAINSHSSAPDSIPLTVSGLSWENIQNLSKAFFDSFNLLYPILDRHSFLSSTLPAAFNEGFTHEAGSTIALLVLALGEVALMSSDGHPVDVRAGGRTGVRGGTKQQPPGLGFFNQARERMGFNLTECSIENVQIFTLAAIYYGTCFHPVDLWRMATSASLACQALITSNLSELSSTRADLIRRVFWTCAIMETCLNLEFGFPLTGLEKMETIVGLPDFSGPFSDEDYICNQESHFQEHFASQIVLRRLLVDFHTVLRQEAPATPLPTSVSSTFVSFNSGTGLNRLVIHQLALQLERWRGMLPVQLRWQEDIPGAFPSINPYTPSLYTSSSGSPLSPAQPPPPPSAPTSTQIASTPLMFTTDLDSPPTHYHFCLDIQVAALRSRYYYTKYLVYRPFIYKALHHPDAVTHDDAIGAAECLKSTLKWPIAMSPTCARKRIVPCLFFFTQNLFGILILLHMSTTVPILRRIRATLCGERFEIDAGETVGLYLDWLRDLKAVDSAAEWQWDVAKAIYKLEV